MTSNSSYQFQIPEAEITIYCASSFNKVEFLLALFIVSCNCLCLSLSMFGYCFVSLFLIYCCCSSYKFIFLLPPLSYPQKKNNFSPLHTNFFLRVMGLNNVSFKLLSLNARGIRSFDKRKTTFNWLCKSGADICFLQETYSSKEVENIWRKQWKGDMFFSHGSSHSRGVLVLVKEQLDFKLLSSKVDD